MEVPGAGGTGSGVGAGGGACATAEHCGDAGSYGFVGLLGRNEVDVGVDAARRGDHAFPRDDLGGGTYLQRYSVHSVGVSGLADPGDPSIPDANVRLRYPPVVHDQGVGYDEVHRAFLTGRNALGHPLPDRLPTPEDRLLTGERQVLLDLYK